MNSLKVLFYFFEVLVALSALSLIFIKNIFNAALAFLICLLAIAALFVMSHAEFPAVAQILLYAGGVVVLIIFGIMLTSKAGKQVVPITNQNLLIGLLTGGALFFLLLFFANTTFLQSPITQMPEASTSTIVPIGYALLTDYVLTFELTGVLLLAILAGAATVAGYKSLKS